MVKTYLALGLIALGLTACMSDMETIVMQNPQTGETVPCTGTINGHLMDRQCVATYREQGWFMASQPPNWVWYR